MQKLIKNQPWWWWLTILMVAAGLRLCMLGQIPPGLTWDEAAIGYTGYAIWTTHRDEWLHFMPISFMSFGDYKAPFAIYLTSLWVGVLGLKVWVVRLPFAIAGVIAVAFMGGLMTEVTKYFHLAQTKAQGYLLTSLAMLILALSPWHLHFSRAGFESGLALTWYLLALWAWFAYLNRPPSRFRLSLILISVVAAVGALYTYHSAKVVLPLMGLVLIFQSWQRHKFKFWELADTIFLGCLLSSPLVYDSIWGLGARRLTQTSLISQDLSFVSKLSLFATNLFSHFSPSFLWLGQVQSYRHGAGEWGVLLPTTALLALAATLWMLRHWSNRKNLAAANFVRVIALGWAMVIIGFVPAALGFDEVPHANRALLALPGFIILAVSGALVIKNWVSGWEINRSLKGNHGESDIVLKTIGGSFLILHLLFSLSFFHHYLSKFPALATTDFQEGYLEAFEIAADYERGLNGKPQVDKIVFTSAYGQPYIYALFSRQTDPIWYQGGSLIKYEFTTVDIGDFERSNTLVVGSGQDALPTHEAQHIIYGHDGSVRFQFFYRP